MLDERKKEPVDYRRTGVVTLFTGLGLFLFGIFFLGSVLKNLGALVSAIGLGQIIAGYLYPNTSEELTNTVENFKKNRRNIMIYKRNLFMHVGLIITLLGIALYDPLGSIYKGSGLMVLAIGLVCLFFGNKYPTEHESINRAVEDFEKK